MSPVDDQRELGVDRSIHGLGWVEIRLMRIFGANWWREHSSFLADRTIGPVICRLLQVVCDVLYCGETVRLS